jgi:hypothetical protein
LHNNSTFYETEENTVTVKDSSSKKAKFTSEDMLSEFKICTPLPAVSDDTMHELDKYLSMRMCDNDGSLILEK